MLSAKRTAKKVVRKKRGTSRSSAIRNVDAKRKAEGKARRLAALKPWKPGQSGNPNGSSRKQRRKKFLKEALRDAMDLPIPEGWRGQLLELELKAKLPTDVVGEMVTIRDLIMSRIVVAAILGDSKAIDQILAAEPSKIDVGITDPEEATEIPTDDDRLTEVAAILGDAEVLH